MAFAPSSLGIPRPRVIEGYVELWKPDKNRFKGMNLLPMENHFLPVVEWDELGQITGQSAAMAPNVEPRNIAHRVLKAYTERGFFFGDSMSLKETDILNIRAAGSLDRTAGKDLVMQMTDTLQVRVDTRVESSIWSAIQGSLAIDENGVKRTITYSTNFAATPTAAVLWSDYNSAAPMLDIQTWLLSFRGKAPTSGIRCYCNREVAIHLSENATVRELLKYNAEIMAIGPDNIGKLLAPLLGLASIEVYDEGYINSAGTWVPFIASNKFIMVAPTPAGGNMGSALGAWKTTPSVRNGGLTPKPGRWVQVFNKLENEPKPEYRQAAGIYGVPIIRFPQSIIVATVAA